MEKSCKLCENIFEIAPGLINFCSQVCKSRYSSTINKKAKNENIKFSSSLNRDNYSNVWIKNCRKCIQLYCSDSKNRKLCFNCNPELTTESHCKVFVGQCRSITCNGLTIQKVSNKKVYCKKCSDRPNKLWGVLKKEIKLTKRIKNSTKIKKIKVIKDNIYKEITKTIKVRNAKEKTTVQRLKTRIIKNCLHCSKQILVKPWQTKKTCCNDYCYRQYCRTTDRYTRMGNNSAKKQNKRSKNEILFSTLLKESLPLYNIQDNYRLIDTWDCDIYIKELNLAILWDGQWHRIQISKQQSLKQVQNRDRIKRKLFLANGINIITVNDFGRYNEKFVHQKLEELIDIIKGITTKEQFNHII